MEKQKLLGPNMKREVIDDSTLVRDSAKSRAYAASQGVDGCCNQLAEFGVKEQEAWKWIRSHFEGFSFGDFKRAYSRACKMITDSTLVRATVKKAAPGGAMLSGHRWRVETDDGLQLWAVITARVRTTKIPTLQVGDTVFVRVHSNDAETCSVDLAESPVQWVGSMKLKRMAEEE